MSATPPDRPSCCGPRRTGSPGDSRLFVVDDAHHLDRLSATLVYQLALSGSARLIVTVRSGAEVPEAVEALWSDGLLTRVEVGPPDDADDGGQLPAQVDDYLAGAAVDPARTTLDYLALAEPLRRDDLTALAGEEAVEQAEAAGALDGRRRRHGATRHIRSTPTRVAGSAGTRHRARVADVAGRATGGRPVRSRRRSAATRGAGRRHRQLRGGDRVRGPASAAVR